VRLLLDTHAFLWWIFADPKLSHRARTAIADDEQNDVLVSAATAWEITTKFRIGKLANAGSVAHDVAAAVAAEGFDALPISVLHAQRAGDLGGPHKDPFDRMLIAQALIENLTLISNEKAFDAYAVKRLW
jgi:PIN domain nuclease of toxin-antitoxin system